MASISKSQGMWRVRIRHKRRSDISKVFARKGDATQWAIQTEEALQLGLLSPDQDCTLVELLHRYAVEVTPRKRSFGREDLHFHDLRHEATSRFFELGLNVVEVAAITGHKDLKMLQRYTHLRAEDLARKLQ